MAAKLLNDMVKDDFSFDNSLWVFSGRRGIHCWICDPEARNMTNDMRSAVTAYYDLPRGNENSDKLFISWPMHPMLRRSYNFLVDFFEDIVVVEQGLLSVDKHREKFLKFLPNPELRDKVRDAWVVCRGDGPAMWRAWQDHYSEWKTSQKKNYDLSIEALVLYYLYPRLDANVSTAINHLLKSPFCVHPKTGNICVPFDPRYVENFKLAEVPTLT